MSFCHKFESTFLVVLVCFFLSSFFFATSGNRAEAASEIS